MTLTEEWAVYERANEEANRAYRVSTCSGCGDLWPHNQPFRDVWMCAPCRRKERRKTA